MSITLTEILDLTGNLADTCEGDTSRERFRRYLDKNLQSTGLIRDYVVECLQNSGPQYNRALQDLVNFIGKYLKFDVTFGRYQGIKGQIGHDGLWKSPSGLYFVIEVKTTDAYSIKTSILLNYINNLISENAIPPESPRLGLYVIGREDAELKQLENAIVAEKRLDVLRMISIDSLLSLAELMEEYDVQHDDILKMLQPAQAKIDPVIKMVTRIIAGKTPSIQTYEDVQIIEQIQPHKTTEYIEINYYLTPVAGDDFESPDQIIERLVVKDKIYAIADGTPNRKKLKPGDNICFYANQIGIVAHAKIKSSPKDQKHPSVRNPEIYHWVFDLEDIHSYFDDPKAIDENMRSELESFLKRDPKKNWGWFVQNTHSLTEHDFKLLTQSKK